MKPAQIESFFATLQAANPMPVTELEYTSVFELLAAVLLSAQATDVGVNKATRKLFPVAGTPQKILDLGLEGLESYIKTIGLYRSKAKHLMETCRILVEQHGGQVPRTREALEALPGVGRKTANVVLGSALGGKGASINDYIVKAVALALVRHPEVNVQVHGDAVHSFAHADVSIKDHTRAITFPVRLEVEGDTARISGDFSLDRADFDLGTSGPLNRLVGPRVQVRVALRMQHVV